MEFFTEEFFRQAYYKHCFDSFANLYFMSIKLAMQNPLVRLQYSVTRGIYLVAATDLIPGSIIQTELRPKELEPTNLIEFKELTSKFAHQFTETSLVVIPGIPMLLKKSSNPNCTYYEDKLITLKEIKSGDILSIYSEDIINYDIRPNNRISKDFIKFTEDLINLFNIEVRYFSVKYKLAEHRYADPLDSLERNFKSIEDRYNRDKKSLEVELDKAKAKVDSIKARLSKLKSRFSEDKENYLIQKEELKVSDSSSN